MSPRIQTNAPVFADSPCPSEEGLRELLEGREGTSDQAWLVGHLDDCAPCQHRLQSLAASDDLWSKTTRTLRESAADEYGELTGLMGRLQTRMLAADETLAPYQACPTSDFLRPCSTPGRLGCVGPYEVVEVLGRGGMGVVYKAIDPALNRTVAIKVLACAPAFSAEARARVRREARAAAAVRSEHAVAIHGVEESAESPYLVMEYVDGHSLQERLDRSGPLEIDEILRIGSQIARGLAAAHAQGLIHRDIKPANILLETGTGKVKITDFGLAKAIDAPSLTQAGTVTGTPEYMAPEQSSDGPIDHRVDLFSLGSVLYAMCTGHPPFRAERSLAVLRRTREDTPVPVGQLRPDAPDSLIAIIEKLHRKDPQERYASAAEVADALEQVGTIEPAAGALAPLSRFGRGAGGEGTLRRRVSWALLAVSILLAVVLSASELAGLTGIVSWAVSTSRRSDPQDAPVSPVEGLKLDVAGRQPTDREPLVMAAAAPRGAKKPVAAAAPDRAPAIENPPSNAPLELTKPLRRFEGHTGPVMSVAFSPDGKQAVSGSGWPQGDCTLRLWEVATGKEVRRFYTDELPMFRGRPKSETPGEVYSVAFAPDGKRVLFAGANGLLGLWDVQTDALARLFEGPKGAEAKRPTIYSVAFLPNGKRFVTGADDKSVRLWDVESGREVQRMTAHTAWVHGVAVSPDGRRALSGSYDRTVRLWDLDKGEQIRRLPERGDLEDLVWSVAYAPDGREAVVAADTISLWDLSDGRLLRTFQGHTGRVAYVVFSPDGRHILSSSYDRSVRLWDRRTGREIATMYNHRNWVRGVAFSPDGKKAISAGGGVGVATVPAPFTPGNDFALRLWQLP